MLQLTDIAKIYGGRRRTAALTDINLSVADGEFLAIVGPSGSGKSTLMNIMGLLDRPSSGRYWLAGEEVSAWSDRRMAQLRNRAIGFVFQSFNLVPTLSARENVELPLVYRGVAPRVRRQVSERWLRRVGLDHRLDYRPAELSGGQQQRVAVARALAGDPKFLLADEPTGNLDDASTREMMRIFEHVREQGQTIVMITHDARFAAVADRMVQLDGGHLTAAEGVSSHANG